MAAVVSVAGLVDNVAVVIVVPPALGADAEKQPVASSATAQQPGTISGTTTRTGHVRQFSQAATVLAWCPTATALVLGTMRKQVAG